MSLVIQPITGLTIAQTVPVPPPSAPAEPTPGPTALETLTPVLSPNLGSTGEATAQEDKRTPTTTLTLEPDLEDTPRDESNNRTPLRMAIVAVVPVALLILSLLAYRRIKKT